MTDKPASAVEIAAQLERAVNVLQPLATTDYLFVAPNAAPGCELTFSAIRQAIDSLRQLDAARAENEALRKNAERWQEAKRRSFYYSMPNPEFLIDCATPHYGGKASEDFEKAIDAALSGREK